MFCSSRTEAAVLLSSSGCSLLLYPGAFNMTTGPAHWELLQRGRSVPGRPGSWHNGPGTAWKESRLSQNVAREVMGKSVRWDIIWGRRGAKKDEVVSGLQPESRSVLTDLVTGLFLLFFHPLFWITIIFVYSSLVSKTKVSECFIGKSLACNIVKFKRWN